MGLGSIFYGGAGGTQLGDVSFDVVSRERMSLAATVTANPVEDGTVVADHVKQEPDEVSLDVIISQTPIDYTRVFIMSPTEPEDAYARLVEIKEAGELVTLYTMVGEFPDYLITKLERERSAETGDSVQCSISLRKIRKVTSQTVAAPTRVVKKPTKAKGKVATTPASPAQATKATGLITAIFGG